MTSLAQLVIIAILLAYIGWCIGVIAGVWQ
jgi:hypothetical protein